MSNMDTGWYVLYPNKLIIHWQILTKVKNLFYRVVGFGNIQNCNVIDSLFSLLMSYQWLKFLSNNLVYI